MKGFMERVAQAVIDGAADLDSLCKVFPRVAKADLSTAIKSAAGYGYISVTRKGTKGHLTQWGAGPNRLEQLPKLASVWELGCPRQQWPQGWQGTIHRPMGGWVCEHDTEENRDHSPAPLG